MAESQKQPVDLLSSQWAEIGKHLSEGALRSMQCLGARGDGVEQAYQEGTRTARQVVEETLDLERDMVKLWRREARTTPPENAFWEMLASVFEQGIEARANAWDGIFRACENVNMQGFEPMRRSVWMPAEMFSSATGASSLSNSGQAQGQGKLSATKQEPGAAMAKATSPPTEHRSPD